MSDHFKSPTPEVPTGTPLTVPIHPKPPETNTQPLEDSAAPRLPADNLNRSKRGRIPSAKWEEHKDTLYNLYVVQGLTLERTMAFMDKHHDFQASHRFKSWRMTKKLRKADVNKETTPQLKEPGSNYSETLASDNNFSGTRAQRYPTKHGESIPTKTNTVVQASHANDASPPMATGTTAENLTTEKPTENNVPCVAFFGGAFNASSDVQMLCADMKPLSLDELLMMQTEALKQISHGHLDVAISMLRIAIFRQKEIYKSYHPTIAAALWHLADAYALKQDFQHADGVIDLISTGYGQELGLQHPRTLDHYQRIVVNLQAVGRSNVARSLGFLLFTAIRDNLPPTEIISVRQAAVTDHNCFGVTDSPEFQRIFSEHLDADQMDRQLKLAAIWSSANLPRMGIMVAKLIMKFQLLPLNLRGREIKARCIAINSSLDAKALLAASSECLPARNTLTSLILVADTEQLAELIPLARELQYLHHLAQDTSGRDAIGGWIAHLIQDEILKPFQGSLVRAFSGV
ncbi:hypothetical protein Neosp_011833 [[Neocosmospora] mangrovei]